MWRLKNTKHGRIVKSEEKSVDEIFERQATTNRYWLKAIEKSKAIIRHSLKRAQFFSLQILCLRLGDFDCDVGELQNRQFIDKATKVHSRKKALKGTMWWIAELFFLPDMATSTPTQTE